MKRIIISISILFLFFSCEDVVNIDLNEGETEFVVNASIDWIKGTNGAKQTIILSKTSAYFGNEYPKVSGASVSVRDANNTFNFKEEGTGVYVCRNFQPKYNEEYRLQVNYDGIIYESVDTLRSPLNISNIVQTDKGGINNEDREVEIHFTTEDNNSSEYFLLEATDNYNAVPFYFVIDGDDFQNREYFIIGSSEDWEKGDKLNFKIYHISKTYYDYMSRLLAIANKYSGSPFTTPLSRVQGNIVNTTNSKENPLGAFRVTSCLTTTIVIE